MLDSRRANVFSFCLPKDMEHVRKCTSLKTACASSRVDVPSGDLSNLPASCMGLSMQCSGSGNISLISSNTNVPTSTWQRPLVACFIVQPRCSDISNSLLYKRCFLNATPVQNMRP
ncbi:hypothetical protein AAFF_G00027090 [Aldrovandia affinis]|uniref:Uncharacterized protein n=1 Tax=Aldrovandia affinis TaxID=143900 RepID=A0AAD7S6Q9_9TELE|nr:hypothetical protein AAFF_G00027090 [Aldrovandia affinis]